LKQGKVGLPVGHVALRDEELHADVHVECGTEEVIQYNHRPGLPNCKKNVQCAIKNIILVA
jgi:hypothetical protein